ncbi:hypothetical protein ACLOJK_027134 [Asimina triloba]
MASHLPLEQGSSNQRREMAKGVVVYIISTSPTYSKSATASPSAIRQSAGTEEIV